MWVAPQKHTRAQSPRRYAHVKYSNGGCSGFEPDFLFIYSVHNFLRYSVFSLVYHIFLPIARENAKILSENCRACACYGISVIPLRQSEKNASDSPPSSVAFGATFPLKGEGFRNFCK